MTTQLTTSYPLTWPGIWRTYRPGQENDKRPSPAYIETAKMVQEWIRGQGKGGEYGQ